MVGHYHFICILNEKGIKKIDQEIYKEMIDDYFGVELVDEIQLCSIREKQEDGYYKIESSMKLIDDQKNT